MTRRTQSSDKKRNVFRYQSFLHIFNLRDILIDDFHSNIFVYHKLY